MRDRKGEVVEKDNIVGLKKRVRYLKERKLGVGVSNREQGGGDNNVKGYCVAAKNSLPSFKISIASSA